MPANCDAMNLCNTAKNCIWYQLIHSKIEFRHRYLSMQWLYSVMDCQMVDNNRDDMMNRLVLNYQESR